MQTPSPQTVLGVATESGKTAVTYGAALFAGLLVFGLVGLALGTSSTTATGAIDAPAGG